MQLRSFKELQILKSLEDRHEAYERFARRGFSERTIGALVNQRLDTPEILLTMSEAELRRLPGIGDIGLEEIKKYRGRFVNE